MDHIRIYRSDNEWLATTDTDDKTYRVSLDGISNEEFRSLGLHPEGGVKLLVGAGGSIQDITLIRTNQPIDSLTIQRSHSLFNEVNLCLLH